MTSKSNENGRAYEYAWVMALHDVLLSHRKVVIVDNSSLIANKKAWDNLSKVEQHLMEISANSAVGTLLDLEPRILENNNDVLLLELQKDEKGREGDVRDLLVKRDSISWEIGLSIKHNHNAVKHSRLSTNLDFGNTWFDVPCSDKYWNDVKPLFDWLAREKEKGSKWSEIPDKDEKIYRPLLQAFIDEMNRASIYDEMPKRLIEYLIGVKDYYKVVSHNSQKKTIISAFNVHNTLNQPGEVVVSAIVLPIVELPSELVAIKFKTGSNNTVEVYFNNGWQLSFRIHNASSRVEPSLKFDIQFVGMPATVFNIECHWETQN